MTDLRPSQHPRREPSFPGVSPAQLGMHVGLVSLSMLFGASLVGYFVTRAQSKVWRTVEMPHLPSGLWLSTAVLLALSLALHYAARRLRANRYSDVERGLLIAVVLGAAFLLIQVQNWRTVATAELNATVQSLYSFTFYMLTALHALHVVAGFVPLLRVYFRARKQHYSSSNSEGLRLVLQYWDFLLVVWLILLLSLWVGS